MSAYRRVIGADGVIRTVLDDETAERLRAAAEKRGIEVEQLIILVLTAACPRIDELLGPSRGLDDD